MTTTSFTATSNRQHPFDQYGIARISDLGFAKAIHSDASLSLSMSGGMIGTSCLHGA